MIEIRLSTAAPAARASYVDRHIGRRIRDLRRAIGLTQSDFAKLLGISNQQFHKYEAGINRIPSGRLYAIARIFEAPIDWFFEGLGDDALAETSAPLSPRVLEFLKNFEAIADPAQRQAIGKMARHLAAPANSRPG